MHDPGCNAPLDVRRRGLFTRELLVDVLDGLDDHVVELLAPGKTAPLPHYRSWRSTRVGTYAQRSTGDAKLSTTAREAQYRRWRITRVRTYALLSTGAGVASTGVGVARAYGGSGLTSWPPPACPRGCSSLAA
eukprot:2397179-Rhodomonas_salina.3